MMVRQSMPLFNALLMLAASTQLSAPEPQTLIPRILEGAHRQVGRTLHYDPRYRAIPFPGGDVPIERGVCTDVIVRAYRHADVDLQVLVHDDMSRSFRSYPQRWGQSGPDPNIDHRRVANLATFFTRHGQSLPVSRQAGDYLPGDLVTWRLPGGAAHIGIVSDREQNGRRLVVHHLRGGTRVDDILFKYEITGHYRYDPQASN